MNEHKKSQHQPQEGTVTLSSCLLLFIGIPGMLFSGFMGIVSLMQNAVGTAAVFGVFFLLSLYLFLLPLNWRIMYDTEGFTYRDIFRISHHYTYGQITRIHYGKDSWIRAGRRIILVDSMADGGRKFVRICYQYAPDARSTRDSDSKLFNGNVKNPGEFVFVYTLLFVLIVGFMIWGEFSMKDLREDRLLTIQTAFTKCEEIIGEENSYWILTTADGAYQFKLYADDPDTGEAVREHIEKGSEFTVYLDAGKGDDPDSKRLVQLVCGDQVLLSMEETNRHYGEVRKLFRCFSAGLLLFWLLYVVISSYVMCRAARFPRAVRWFVKDGYLIRKKER